MAIGRETWPALYQQLHIMKPCRSAGSELPPLVLTAYKVFPFVCICGLPAFFEVGTWSNLGLLQNENLCKKSMVKEIVFVVGKWEMPLLLTQSSQQVEKKPPGFKYLSFPSAASKFKPIYRISGVPVNITLLCDSERKGWLVFFKQEIWQEEDAK